MKAKSKILVIGCSCLIAVAGFTMTTMNTDHDGVIGLFYSTTDGSYFTKHLTANDEVSVDKEDGTDSPTGGVESGEIYWKGKYTGSYMTTDPQALELIEKVKKADCSDQRKTVAIWALANVGNPAAPYSYGARHDAGYKSPDAAPMDCSSFVAWCYYNGGLDTGILSTGDMAAIAEHSSLDEMIQGGDIHIGDAVMTPGRGHTAVAVYVENGLIYFVHEPSSGHLIEVGDTGSYVAFGKGWHKLSDAEASKGGSSSSGSVTPGSVEKVKAQNAAGIKLPDTEFTLYTAKDNRKDKIIMLDPGHGDPNIKSKVSDFSVGEYFSPRGGLYNGETEENFAQAVADITRDKLLAAGFDVLMSRDDSTALTPNKLRSRVASERASLQVCIHWNGGGANGPVLVVPRDYAARPWKDEVNGLWALCGPKLAQHLGSSVRGNYEFGASVFGMDFNLPILYIETGFADGAVDGPNLVGDANHEKIADAIASSIIEYYK